MTNLTTAQVALALTIVRYHFSHLKTSIKAISRKLSQNDSYCIDGALFWKRACEKSKSERAELRNKIVELEQQLQKQESLCTRDSLESGHKRNETHESKQAAIANTQSKRRQVATSSPAAKELEFNYDISCNEKRSDRQNLLRAFYDLRQAVTKRETMQQEIIHMVRNGCHCIVQYMKNVCDAELQTAHSISALSDKSEARKVMSHVWGVMLDSLVEKESRMSSRNRAIIIAQMTFLFQALLGQVHQHSLDAADQQEKQARSKQPNSVAVMLPGKRPAEISCSKYDACNEYTILMFSFLQGLDIKSEPHFELLKGIMSVLLDHIGSAMSLLVFADPDLGRKRFLGLLPPRGLVDVVHIETSTALLTCRISAPFLIFVLRKAMSITESVSSTVAESGAVDDHVNARDRFQPISKLKRQLQETLLRAIYEEEDGSFELALQRYDLSAVLQIDGLSQCVSESNKNEDWLISQVWECLGWDILASKIDGVRRDGKEADLLGRPSH